MPPRDVVIGGVAARVFDLDALADRRRDGDVAALFLLHGRGNTQDQMRDLAERAAAESSARADRDDTLPLLVVTLDQRNHGDRVVDEARNASLRDKDGAIVNATHAMDMVATVAGTAQDVSLLADFLEPALFPDGERRIQRFAVAGFSLGGHVTWQVAARDARFVHLAPICGSPSLLSVLDGRQAPLPDSLRTRLLEWDADRTPTSTWRGRDVLALFGAKDTIVPPDVRLLDSIGGDGAHVDRLVQRGAGHKVTPEMERRVLDWLATRVARRAA